MIKKGRLKMSKLKLKEKVGQVKEKEPPNSIEAEHDVLGSILKDPNALNAIKSDLNNEQVFYSPRHRTIFRAVLNLSDRGEPYDVTTVSEELKEMGELEKIGGRLYLIDLIDSVVSVSNIATHAKIITEKYVQRNLIQAAYRMQGAEDLDELFYTLQEERNNLSRFGITSESLSDFLTKKQERDKARTNLALGYCLTKFVKLSDNISGIQPGFYIIGAETNVGKTALLTNLFLDLMTTEPNMTGLYFSLDDSRSVIVNRFLAIKSGIPINDVQRPHGDVAKQAKIDSVYDKLRDWDAKGRLVLKDQAEISHIGALENEIRARAQESDGRLFVVIDGLYNLEIGKEYGDQRAKNIDRANRIKGIVDTYNIPIIVTGELRKRGVDAKDRPPVIDDLMETGKFAYNANMVWLLYPENREDFDNSDKVVLKLKYAKNKLSDYRKTQDLEFTKALGFIEESSGVDYSKSSF
jgi:replicative DNA helicase